MMSLVLLGSSVGEYISDTPVHTFDRLFEMYESNDIYVTTIEKLYSQTGLVNEPFSTRFWYDEYCKSFAKNFHWFY